MLKLIVKVNAVAADSGYNADSVDNRQNRTHEPISSNQRHRVGVRQVAAAPGI